jgi:Flp pilus assembly pilin Flp
MTPVRYLLWIALSRVTAWHEEDGQDLVEYALIVALLAFAVTAGEQALAADINSVFAQLSGYVP